MRNRLYESQQHTKQRHHGALADPISCHEMGKAMKPNEKRLLANYVGLEGLTSDELDQLFALMEEAARNADQLPTLHCDDEPALTFFVPQIAAAP